jgi:hypothetical protein
MQPLAPEILNLRGWNPESATRCVTDTEGKCLGDLAPQGSIVTWDTAVAPISGEHAMIRLPGDILTTKKLEHFAGRWFMHSVDGWHELHAAQCRVLGKIVRIVRYPLSRVLVAPDEVIPPGYREDQARTMAQIGPLMVAHGLDRTTAYPVKSQAEGLWMASANRWEYPQACGIVGKLSAALARPYVELLMLLLSPLLRRL